MEDIIQIDPLHPKPLFPSPTINLIASTFYLPVFVFPTCVLSATQNPQFYPPREVFTVVLFGTRSVVWRARAKLLAAHHCDKTSGLNAVKC